MGNFAEPRQPSMQTLKLNNHAVLTIIEGEGTLTVEGKSREFVAGDTFVFQPGVEAHWATRTPLRDWFVMYGPFER
ncbi:cupin domain-containing protein [Rhodococcus koreensis]